MIYVTSDLHLCHDKNFLYEPRGYQSIIAHDVDLVNRWNSIVRPDDEVYVLGDMIMNDVETGIFYLNQLKGKIKFVCGNHDTVNKIQAITANTNCQFCGYATMLKYGKYNFYLSHYPTITSNWDFDKPLKSRVISLCGHTHTQDRFKDWDKGLIYHCELDAHNMYPVPIVWIFEDIRNKYNETHEE